MVWNVKAARHVYSRLTVLFLIHQISSQRYWERVPQLTLVAMTRNLTSLDSKLTLKMVLNKVQANFFPLLFKIILNKGIHFKKKGKKKIEISSTLQLFIHFYIHKTQLHHKRTFLSSKYTLFWKCLDVIRLFVGKSFPIVIDDSTMVSLEQKRFSKKLG